MTASFQYTYAVRSCWILPRPELNHARALRQFRAEEKARFVQCRLISLKFERGMGGWAGKRGGAGRVKASTRSMSARLGLAAISNSPHRNGRDESGRYVCEPTLQHSLLTPLFTLQPTNRLACALCGKFAKSARASLIVG